MPERLDKWLKVCCLVFGLLLLFHVTQFAWRKAPLAKLRIPAVPTLPATNAPTATNTVSSTNATAKTGTNTLTATNTVAGTNTAAKSGTNVSATTITNTNGVATNMAKSGTNAPASTNAVATTPPTNSLPPSVATARSGGPSGSGGPGALGPDVPPAVKARVEKITASEIFGPVVRPLPMALLGIAGREAFMRAPNGQTGLMKEGDELGGIKMVRIGTNRVLVDEEGQKKELMIFAGIGSESLMPKDKEIKNEPTNKAP